VVPREPGSAAIASFLHVFLSAGRRTPPGP